MHRFVLGRFSAVCSAIVGAFLLGGCDEVGTSSKPIFAPGSSDLSGMTSGYYSGDFFHLMPDGRVVIPYVDNPGVLSFRRISANVFWTQVELPGLNGHYLLRVSADGNRVESAQLMCNREAILQAARAVDNQVEQKKQGHCTKLSFETASEGSVLRLFRAALAAEARESGAIVWADGFVRENNRAQAQQDYRARAEKRLMELK